MEGYILSLTQMMDSFSCLKFNSVFLLWNKPTRNASGRIYPTLTLIMDSYNLTPRASLVTCSCTLIRLYQKPCTWSSSDTFVLLNKGYHVMWHLGIIVDGTLRIKSNKKASHRRSLFQNIKKCIWMLSRKIYSFFVWNPSLAINDCHNLASLVMQNGDHRDIFFIPSLHSW